MAASGKIKTLRGSKIVIFIIILCALVFHYQSPAKKSATNQTCGATMEINSQSPDIVLTQNHELRTCEIEENKLSGVVKFGAKIKTISFVSPGDAELWFITPKGYKIISVKNGEDSFLNKGEKFPSRAFRIRGQKGIATIQSWA